MKKVFMLLTITMSLSVSSQVNKNTYLYFDSFSKATHTVEDNGKIFKEKFFIKEIKENGNIIFYINKEMLSFNNKSNEIDSLKIDVLDDMETSNINNLKKEVNKKNALYPYKVYPNLFLLEKINDSTIIKYKVKWEYYIN